MKPASFCRPTSTDPLARQEDCDELLMKAAATGDRQAFSLLVERYARRAYAVAWRLLFNRAQAEDVVQEAWIKVWVHAANWNLEKGKFSTWFYRVLTNACIDARRKKTTLPLDETADIADPSISAEQRIMNRQMARQMQQAIATLPPRQQVALTLCYYENISNQQAAEILGVHLKALEALLVRARRTLRQLLKPEQEGKNG